MATTMVNGYACRNCNEVSKAKRGIDPRETLAERAQLDRLQAEQAQGGIQNSQVGSTTSVNGAGSIADARVPLEYSRFVDRLA
jgi:hypothetical protein